MLIKKNKKAIYNQHFNHPLILFLPKLYKIA